MKEFKQVILVRKDLNLSKGKMSVQVSHASVSAVLNSSKSIVSTWQDQGMKKSVLKVPDIKTLIKYKKLAESAGLVVSLISDAGHTHIKSGTITCLGIGPDEEKKIDSVTGSLQLY